MTLSRAAQRGRLMSDFTDSKKGSPILSDHKKAGIARYLSS
jgi:hypothetical protein